MGIIFNKHKQEEKIPYSLIRINIKHISQYFLKSKIRIGFFLIVKVAIKYIYTHKEGNKYP